MSERTGKILVCLYLIGFIIAFGHASHNTRDGIFIAPISGAFWPLYISYKVFEPDSKVCKALGIEE